LDRSSIEGCSKWIDGEWELGSEVVVVPANDTAGEVIDSAFDEEKAGFDAGHSSSLDASEGTRDTRTRTAPTAAVVARTLASLDRALEEMSPTRVNLIVGCCKWGAQGRYAASLRLLP
jgi:hypothetical protein